MTSEYDDFLSELQEIDAKARGFTDKVEMNRMISRIDCDSHKVLHGFLLWEKSSGSKQELLNILSGKQ